MAATLNTTIMAYAGVDIRQDTLNITPSLPNQWQRLSFHLNHQNVLYHINLTHNDITVTSDKACIISINHHQYHLIDNTAFCLNFNEDKTNG
ncbi:glycosyl hydrolase family 65 protein [Providencia vermicola]